MLADAFEIFRDKCDEIYELAPVHFVSAPRLACHAFIKNTKVKSELITNYDVLMMIENWIRGGICWATDGYTKGKNKYMRNYDKNFESSYLVFLDAKKFVWMGNVSKITSKWF